ncbi:MAG: ribonuclease III [Caulobacteraceae bacterium]
MAKEQSRAALIAALERRLGHAFADRALVERALTHASKLGLGRADVQHNEGLEFLGDRVLGLSIAEALWRRDPDADPDALNKRFAWLVSREACAEVAKAIGLDQALDVPKFQGLRRNDTALADAAEALAAAVFLDAGFDTARQVVLGLWSELLDRPIDFTATNPKTALQEWAQGAGKPLPQYQVVAREGPDHAPQFTVEVTVAGHEPVKASGRSRQEAEKAAAQALLKREGAA